MRTCTKVRFGMALYAGILFTVHGFAADPRLIARYTFEDSSTVAAIDVSDNGHHGIIHGIAKKPSAWGKAAVFPGNTSSWIEIQDHADFKQTAALTIEAFITVTGLPGQHGLIFFRGDGATAGDPWYLCVQPNSAIRFHVEGSDFSVANLETPIMLNTPLHIVATFSAADGVMKLFINGKLAASQLTTVTPGAELPGGAGGGFVSLGNHTYPGGHVFPFTGSIEELSFYNYALDSVAVRERFQALGKVNGLLAHWSFDSCSGITTYFDVTGHGYDALSSGTGLTLSEGLKGQGLNCPGAGYEIVATKTQTAFNLNRFSIECWYNSSADPKNGISNAAQLFCFQNIASGIRNGYAVYINSAGKIDFGMSVKGGGSYVDVVSSTALNAHEWYHIVATYDSTVLRVYLNGVLENTVQNISGGYPAPGTDARIGCQRQINGTVWEFLKGEIDELKFYNIALPSETIADYYHAARPVSPETRNDSIPVLIPVVPEIQTNQKPLLKWHPALGATSYQIVVDTAGDFLKPVIIIPLVDTLFTPQVKLPYGKIFWKVSANTNFTRYSTVDTFIVAAETGAGTTMQHERDDVPSIAFSGKGFQISYTVKERSRVTVKLFSMSGACIATICDEVRAPGTQQVVWNGVEKDGRKVPGGSYLAVCAIGSKVIARKIVLVK